MTRQNDDAREEGHRPLPAARLRQRTDPASLGAVGDGAPAALGLIGQTRAFDAIRFGSGTRAPGFNLFAMGLPGTGRHSAIRAFLEDRAAGSRPPDDWVYVNNFDDPGKPRALCLPAGAGMRFRAAMDDLVAELVVTIPALFESDEYKARRGALDQDFEERQEEAFSGVNKAAAEKSIAIMRTPVGFAFAPMREGEVVKPEQFAKLPEAERDRIQADIKALQEAMKQVLEQMPRLEKARRDGIRKVNKEMAGGTVEAAIREVRGKFPEMAAIQAHLDAVAGDLVGSLELFLKTAAQAADAPVAPTGVAAEQEPRLHRYAVNVIVGDHDPEGRGGQDDSGTADGTAPGAPVIWEPNPTHGNLIGRVEHVSRMGALTTDFTLIRPGALHRANGGALILNARDLLLQPFAWDALKRSLRSGAITIASLGEQLNLLSTISLEPDPIPLDVKVVLIGDRTTYYLLLQLDPDFPDLFKVQADFNDDFARTPENTALYARLLAALAAREGLRPIDNGGLARMVDETARFAGDSEKLSLQVGQVADILREADYWAGESGRDAVTADDVAQAVRQRRHRGDRIRLRMQEAITRDIVLIETDGRVVGQVNGLAVLEFGGQSFGRPSRITASARLGTGRVIDIEREVELGGPLHSKGVLILSSFLAAHYALDVPVSLSASLVFEQSYGGIDGDSASSAELYALLSALSEVPLDQSFAVTGSVNQLGQVQAIGGVNEKVEGFFDICAARGLTGRQGVLIPEANVAHLMLREDVVEACAAGRFGVYAVGSIDQGIEILTGRAAGRRDAAGNFPPDSVNGLVEARLRDFAETRRGFARKYAAEGGDVDRAG